MTSTPAPASGGVPPQGLHSTCKWQPSPLLGLWASSCFTFGREHTFPFHWTELLPAPPMGYPRQVHTAGFCTRQNRSATNPKLWSAGHKSWPAPHAPFSPASRLWFFLPRGALAVPTICTALGADGTGEKESGLDDLGEMSRKKVWTSLSRWMWGRPRITLYFPYLGLRSWC